jgi:hypothetical protein
MFHVEGIAIDTHMALSVQLASLHLSLVFSSSYVCTVCLSVGEAKSVVVHF